LAPVIVEQLAAMVLGLKQGGLAILLSEQNLRFAGVVADRALIIERGQIRHAGPLAEMIADERLRAAHLAV
jgi:branched-chain amino acid transport system ATP-binding protein